MKLIRAVIPSVIVGSVLVWNGVLKAGPSDVSGTLDWPAEWVVFLPLEREDHLLPEETLKSIPESVEVPGFHGAVKAIPGRRVQAENGIRFDFAPLFEGVKVNNTAYAFLELNSDKEQTVTLGMGADWWLQAWLNGVEVMNTLAAGNVAWPPSISNYAVDVKLKKGMNVLAVRFISGSGSSVLTLGGPDQLRAIPPEQWAKVEIKKEDSPGLQAVCNHDFEGGGGGDPFIPEGWHNGKGKHAFLQGELKLRTVAPIISGKASLEINTMGGGDGSRKLYIPLAVDISKLYEVSFMGQYLGGEYASISVRNDIDGSNTSFIQSVGNVNVIGVLRSASPEVYRRTYYNDIPRPYLVIQTHGEVNVVLDDISIVLREDGSQWVAGWDQQLIPWGNEWRVVSDKIETPHTRWAKPYAGGELKVVTIMPRGFHRWTVELAQRMSVSYKTVIFSSNIDVNYNLGNDYWIRGADGEPEVFRILDDALETLSAPADCIVMRYLSPTGIPASLVETILAQVQAGAGLVIFGDPIHPWLGDPPEKYLEGAWAEALNKDNLIEEGIGYISSDVFPGGEAKCYRYGKGRIAFLKGGAKWPPPEEETTLAGVGRCLRGEFEAEISYIMKAMVWASGRLPAAHMSRFILPGKQDGILRCSITRKQLPAAMQVVFSAPLATAGELSWWFDDYTNYGRKMPGGEIQLAAGSESARIELPRLPGGTHWLHMQLKTEEGDITDWNIACLDVSPEVGIKDIKLGRDKVIYGRFFTQGYYREGERIEGSVLLDGPAGEGCFLRLRLTDADGHLWQEKEIGGISGSEILFSLEIDRAVVLMHTLEAELAGPEGIVDTHMRTVAIARDQAWYDNTYDFQMFDMPGGNNYLGTLMAEQYRKTHGVTSSFWGNGRSNAFNNIRSISRAGLNFPAEGLEPPVVGDKEHAPIRSACLTDPDDGRPHDCYAIPHDIRPHAEQNIEQKTLLDSLPYAPLAYAMTHECNLLKGISYGVDICFSDNCTAHLRNFLRKEYGTMEALNTSWGTAFKEWGEVRPIVLADAIKAGQITRWIDHRRHMDRVFADFLQYKIDVVRRHDSAAQAVSDDFGWGEEGSSGASGSFSGIDFQILVSEVLAGSMLPLPHLRAFSPPERKHLVMGRGDTFCVPKIHTPNQELYGLRFGEQPWIFLFEDLHGFDYWAGQQFPGSNFRQTLLADLRTTEEGRWPIEPVAQIRTGIDRLIFESRFDDSGIAVLYSRSSEHAATAWQEIQGGAAAKKLHPSRQFWLFTRILELLGYQYCAISEQQIIGGMLQKKGIRLLILPFAQALDVEAAKAVKDFVAAGGMLLADIRPAVADRHGRTAAQGHLDEVFGVLHNTDWKDYRPIETGMTFSGESDGLKMRMANMPVITGPAVKLTTAKSVGEANNIFVMLANRYGAGRAVLLNFTPLVADRGMFDMMQRLMGWYGLKPLFGVETLQVRRPEKYQPAEVVSLEAELERPTISHYSNGNIHSFALWHSFIIQLDSGKRRGVGTELLRITPPVAGYIYNLKNNKYLGQRSSFEAEIPMEGLGAYAVVPYRIEKPRLDISEDVTEAGNIRLLSRVRVAPAAATKERHVVRLRLFAPDGSEWKDFAENIVAADGVGTHEFILPLNAPRGEWRVEAREAISGLADSASLRLK